MTHLVIPSAVQPRAYNFVLSDVLAMGGCPEEGHALARAGFRTLVLCAEEHQPPGQAFPGVDVIHVPFDDALAPLTAAQLEPIQRAAALVAARAREALRAPGHHGKVLVTCFAGRNRSGLVTALAIEELTRGSGATAESIIERIRQRRGRAALGNPYFESLLRRRMRYRAAVAQRPRRRA
jgi:hypothetical protein